MRTTTKVFLSYAREDLSEATRLANQLAVLGIDVWLDVLKLNPGDHWATKIENAIAASDFFLALLSSNSVSKKGYVQKELYEALKILELLPPEETFIIPIRLDDCTPRHKKIWDYHFADLFPSWDEGVKKLSKAILGEHVSFEDSFQVNDFDIDHWENMFERAKIGLNVGSKCYVQAAFNRETVINLPFDTGSSKSYLNFDYLYSNGLIEDILQLNYMILRGHTITFINVTIPLILFDSANKQLIQVEHRFLAVKNWKDIPFLIRSKEGSREGIIGHDFLGIPNLEICLYEGDVVRLKQLPSQ